MTKDISSDQKYIEGLLNGDDLVIKEIYGQFHKAIIHMVETNRGTMEDARDVFQEGLMLVYQKAGEPGFQLSSSFLSYFYGICRFLWNNKVKKKSNQSVTLTDEMTSMLKDLSAPEVGQQEQFYLYRQKFRLLGRDCQELLSLFFDKISMSDIMTKMGFSSISYTKKRKFQCKKKLIELIENDPKYQELKY